MLPGLWKYPRQRAKWRSLSSNGLLCTVLLKEIEFYVFYATTACKSRELSGRRRFNRKTGSNPDAPFQAGVSTTLLPLRDFRLVKVSQKFIPSKDCVSPWPQKCATNFCSMRPIVGHAALRSYYGLSNQNLGPIRVQFGSNKDLYRLFSTQKCFVFCS